MHGDRLGAKEGKDSFFLLQVYKLFCSPPPICALSETIRMLSLDSCHRLSTQGLRPTDVHIFSLEPGAPTLRPDSG